MDIQSADRATIDDPASYVAAVQWVFALQRLASGSLLPPRQDSDAARSAAREVDALLRGRVTPANEEFSASERALGTPTNGTQAGVMSALTPRALVEYARYLDWLTAQPADDLRASLRNDESFMVVWGLDGRAERLDMSTSTAAAVRSDLLEDLVLAATALEFHARIAPPGSAHESAAKRLLRVNRDATDLLLATSARLTRAAEELERADRNALHDVGAAALLARGDETVKKLLGQVAEAFVELSWERDGFEAVFPHETPAWAIVDGRWRGCTPDITMQRDDRLWVIEVKSGGNSLTSAQKVVMPALATNGGAFAPGMRSHDMQRSVDPLEREDSVAYTADELVVMVVHCATIEEQRLRAALGDEITRWGVEPARAVLRAHPEWDHLRHRFADLAGRAARADDAGTQQLFRDLARAQQRIAVGLAEKRFLGSMQPFDEGHVYYRGVQETEEFRDHPRIKVLRDALDDRVMQIMESRGIDGSGRSRS
ncbi:MAG: hypothetical protein ACOYNI_06315 [Acidimicrobiia bacterium]